jgi:hypothetical protein
MIRTLGAYNWFDVRILIITVHLNLIYPRRVRHDVKHLLSPLVKHVGMRGSSSTAHH